MRETVWRSILNGELTRKRFDFFQITRRINEKDEFEHDDEGKWCHVQG
jgi:hypothetical protein